MDTTCNPFSDGSVRLSTPPSQGRVKTTPIFSRPVSRGPRQSRCCAMFSFVNRMDTRLLKRVLVFALAGVLTFGALAPVKITAKDARKPHVIPGDGDGPAGVQDAVVVQGRGKSPVLPLWLPLGPTTNSFVVIRVALPKTLPWFSMISIETRALGDQSR
jgi:hypothetical protein